jgi:hypothetical protein
MFYQVQLHLSAPIDRVTGNQHDYMALIHSLHFLRGRVLHFMQEFAG